MQSNLGSVKHLNWLVLHACPSTDWNESSQTPKIFNEQRFFPTMPLVCQCCLRDVLVKGFNKLCSLGPYGSLSQIILCETIHSGDKSRTKQNLTKSFITHFDHEIRKVGTFFHDYETLSAEFYILKNKIDKIRDKLWW